MVADVQGSKGGGGGCSFCCDEQWIDVCVWCVCVQWGGVVEGVMLNDLFIKFTNQKPVFVCWPSVVS